MAKFDSFKPDDKQRAELNGLFNSVNFTDPAVKEALQGHLNQLTGPTVTADPKQTLYNLKGPITVNSQAYNLHLDNTTDPATLIGGAFVADADVSAYSQFIAKFNEILNNNKQDTEVVSPKFTTPTDEQLLANGFTKVKPVAPPPPPSGIHTTTDFGGPDPIQGYDVDIWVQRLDLATAGLGDTPPSDTNLAFGGQVLLGSFTNIKLMIRNSTEAYLEWDSRNPIYFDGETQIAFSLEKGLIDMDVLRETFGVSVFGYRTSYNLLPRMNITFNVNTVSYDREGRPVSELNHEVDYGRGASAEPQQKQSGSNSLLDQIGSFFGNNANVPPEVTHIKFKRKPNGRFVLKSCKIDAFNIDAGAGKQVVATQWTGVAEEIVSLGGDPPALQPDKNNNGALDTIPTRMADTTFSLNQDPATIRRATTENLVEVNK
jgi:hypothetical protein